jgi:tRNA(Ile)-lysidine synthase TilS/MesJ
VSNRKPVKYAEDNLESKEEKHFITLNIATYRPKIPKQEIITNNVATLLLATHQRDIAGTRAHQPTTFLGRVKRVAGAHGMAEINGGEFGHWPWGGWYLRAAAKQRCSSYTQKETRYGRVFTRRPMRSELKAFVDKRRYKRGALLARAIVWK